MTVTGDELATTCRVAALRRGSLGNGSEASSSSESTASAKHSLLTRSHHGPLPPLDPFSCTNVTSEIALIAAALGIPASPYTGADITCSSGTVTGDIYWSIESGYGDTCSLSAYSFPLPSFQANDCEGVSIDGLGFSITVAC